MRKILLVLVLNFITIASFAQAVVRIVAGTSLQAAIDNATAGTTFLVEPGSYGDIFVNKKVALIGAGYFLNTNASAGCNNIHFNPGSDNSIITGFLVNIIYIGANNVTVQRNMVNNTIDVGYSQADGGTYVGGNVIKQNFVTKILLRYSTGWNNYVATNTLIKNNIILGEIVVGHATNSGQAINNTILNNGGCGQSYDATWSMTFTNNIVVSNCNYTSNPNGRYSTNSTFTNNLIKTTHFSTGDESNIKVENFNNVFVGYPNNNSSTTDGRYQLLSNSPAKGKGIGGVDLGAFGGSEAYVLQGIPIGPNVLSVVAPTGAAAGQTISVQIQARVQN